MGKKKYYITTAIDYTNNVVHIGHMLQKVAADVLARYHRFLLGNDNVFFLTGVDEYGQNIEKAAEKNGVTPKEWVDKVAEEDKHQHLALNISSNRFIRTTDQDHHQVAREIWRRVEKNGDIYLEKYAGLYCTSCEAYYTKTDLVNGKCLFHPSLELQKINEENYFFKWSKYQDFLIKNLESNPHFLIPESRRREMLEFARRGIHDIPISRTSFNWGIPAPDHSGHVLYVWFDALTNYLTGVGFLKNLQMFQKFWPADLHILGKDNVRWHALLWPAILKSAGIELPRQIYGHGFLSLNGQKMSKTLGNIIRPTDWVTKYGTDAIRYYLLRYSSLEEDSDVSEKKLTQAYTADLANGLGNLVARVAKLCENNSIDIGSKLACDHFEVPVEIALENFKFNEALNFIWSRISEIDKEINNQKPWELEGKRAKEILTDLALEIQDIAFNLQPFLPETSEKILKQFSGEIKSSEPLFPRI